MRNGLRDGGTAGVRAFAADDHGEPAVPGCLGGGRLSGRGLRDGGAPGECRLCDPAACGAALAASRGRDVCQPSPVRTATGSWAARDGDRDQAARSGPGSGGLAGGSGGWRGAAGRDRQDGAWVARGGNPVTVGLCLRAEPADLIACRAALCQRRIGVFHPKPPEDTCARRKRKSSRSVQVASWKTSASRGTSQASSSDVKAAGVSLSRSRTPSSLPWPFQTGRTSSDFVEEEQAM